MTSQYVAPFVNPITFSDDGRLFVGQAFFGETLYELDPDLVDPPVLVWHGSGAPGFPEQLNGFDFGPDGKLYAPQPFMGRIVRIDVDTAALEVVTGRPRMALRGQVRRDGQAVRRRPGRRRCRARRRGDG